APSRQAPAPAHQRSHVFLDGQDPGLAEGASPTPFEKKTLGLLTTLWRYGSRRAGPPQDPAAFRSFRGGRTVCRCGNCPRHRGPLPGLVFVGPLLLAYELGMLWIGGAQAEAGRTGADSWMRHGLAALGLTDHWFPPLCLAIALLAWQAVASREWRFSPLVLLG